METEIKLALHPGDEQRLLAHPLLRDLPAQGRRLLNTYFDTRGLALREARMALRERHIGRERWLTVKTSGSTVAGLSRRGEWEVALAGQRPPFASFVDDAAAREATIAAFQALVALDPPIPPPSHSKSDPVLGFALPKLPNQHAWRALWETVQAAHARSELPPLASEVLAARGALPSPPPLPQYIPNVPIRDDVTCFAEHRAISGPGTPAAQFFGSPEAASAAIVRVFAAARRHAAAWAANGSMFCWPILICSYRRS